MRFLLPATTARRFLLVTLASGLLACGVPPGRSVTPDEVEGEEGEVRVGVVDLNRLLAETPQGREAAAELEALGTTLQGQLDQMAEELQTRAQAIEAAQADNSTQEQELAQMVGEYQQLGARAQRAHEMMQQQLEQARLQMTAPLMQELESVARRVGQARGLSLIVRTDGLAFSQDSADITDVLIAELGGGGGEPDEEEPDGAEDEDFQLSSDGDGQTLQLTP